MKLVKILFFVVICLSLTGCYDKTELDNLAYVIGIGLDVGEAQNGEDDDSDGENLNITYQIAIPVKIAGENNSSGKETYTTYTVSASSLFMGNSIVNAMASKEINLSHINIILYSEEIAKKGLRQMLFPQFYLSSLNSVQLKKIQLDFHTFRIW